MTLAPSVARKLHGVSYPPFDGSLTLPETVEFNATYNPTRPMYVFAGKQENDFEHVSYLEFNRVCQRVAHIIRPATLQGIDNGVVGIVADCDTLLHHTIAFSIICAGLVPLLMSSRNSPVAIAHMMRKTGCQRLIATSHSLGALLNHVRDELASHSDGPMNVAIDDLPMLSYAYPKLDQETANDVFKPYLKGDQRPADDTVMLYLHRVSVEKSVGQLDDVLIHSSGEKTLPAPMESMIGSSPFVSGVCMFGRGRNRTGVLVEPTYAIDVTDERQVAQFRNKIWPEVEEANKDAPAFSRILKEMILVTNKEKPMVRAAKGTVIKKATQALYEVKIGALYASVELSIKAGIDVPLPASWTQIEVENWLIVHATAVHLGKPIRVNVNVFEQGFDSLSSTFLKNRILGSLRASPDNTIRDVASRIGPSVIFANPTLRRLAKYIIQSVAGTDGVPDPKTEIENMIAKYSSGFVGEDDKDVVDSTEWSNRRHVVLLTGSTGGLGSYLLASLLAREDVDTVYAFNRPSKAGKPIQERQRIAFTDREIDSTLLDVHERKLIYLEGDTTQENLSLNDETYAELRDRVTIIVHNAWLLHFNLSLLSFEGHVKGMRHLIDLGLTSKARPRFMFTSSVKSAQGWDECNGTFPEAVQMDAGVAVGPGYGASKYVSERILAMSGLPATSFRIGQISGGTPRGAWSTKEWVPMFVKSSVALGALPNARGVASWIPPQAVSSAILDVAFANAAPPLAVNLVHPRPVPWASLMQSISEAMYQTHQLAQGPLPLIPLSEWVARLNACAMGANEETIRRMPSIKLLNFMRTLVEYDETLRRVLGADGKEGTEAVGFKRFATGVAERKSEAMRTLEPLSAEDAKRWVDYWVSVGWVSEGR